MFTKRCLALPVLFALAGCSSTPTKVLPVQFEKTSQEFALKLETPSRLVVLEPLRKGAACDAKRRDLSLTVRGSGKSGAAPGVRSCTLVAKHTAFRSKEIFAKGDYIVNASGSGRSLPRVTADPEDPDALSGADQDFAGATELGENATVKGSVNFAGGNATNWIKLAKAKGDVSLLLLPEPGSEIEAKIYVLFPGSADPRRTGALSPKSKRTVDGAGGETYVRIQAKRFSGEATYALVRRDIAKVKATSLVVLDFYPVDGKSSLLLLPAHEGLKVEASLRVTGVRSGKAVGLGRCTVTSSSPTQSACRLEAVPPADVSKLRAEWVQEGSAT